MYANNKPVEVTREALVSAVVFGQKGQVAIHTSSGRKTVYPGEDLSIQFANVERPLCVETIIHRESPPIPDLFCLNMMFYGIARLFNMRRFEETTKYRLIFRDAAQLREHALLGAEGAVPLLSTPA